MSSVNYDAILAGNCFGQINMTAPNTDVSSPVMNNGSSETVADEFDRPVHELFDLARAFLKGRQATDRAQQDSDSMHMKYDDNVRLVALSKQAKIGKWDVSYTQDVGFLDVIGNNRKQAWMALGDMSKEQAMEAYVKLLLQCCPAFRTYLHDASRNDDQTRRSLDNIQRISHIEEQKKLREDYQRKQIQDVLNQQTYTQFKTYAEQQYRDNQPAQNELIRQLQEEHFQQYMRQAYQQQILFQQAQLRTKTNMEEQAPTSIDEMPPLAPAPAQLPPLVHPPPLASVPVQFETLSLNTPLQPIPPLPECPAPVTGELSPAEKLVNDQLAANASGDASLMSEAGKRETPTIVPPNMWTRKDLKEFKEQIRKEKDAVIKIGSGETVTVRVPTHEDGRSIFWEFVTDYYDIGFGVYFEWSKAESNAVTVHVSDSSEEEEEGEDGNSPKKDIEKGAGSTNKPPKPPQDEVVPICRRDCHEEVYAGSHTYPGHGVYLLKFDNSYSLWRSKTLYYRVYYSK